MILYVEVGKITFFFILAWWSILNKKKRKKYKYIQSIIYKQVCKKGDRTSGSYVNKEKGKGVYNLNYSIITITYKMSF